MSKEEIESLVRDYIKENLTVQIENRLEWDGRSIVVTLQFIDGTIISESSYFISKVC